MAYSEPTANDALNATFNGSALQVTSRYFALLSVEPTASSSGTELPYVNGYARQGLDSYTAASGGFIASAATLAFSATGVWSAGIVAIGMYSAGSGGQRHLQHGLPATIYVASGENVAWAAGDLEWLIVSCQT